jgi:4-azaleucine resistance transporter AzlC
MKARGLHFWQGARDSLPLVIGALPFGLIFGTLAVGQGLSLAAALGMSVIVFAGSAQFIALGLLAAGASLPVILLTTLVVNLRHFLYAAVLSPRMASLPGWKKALCAFALTDESFAVMAGRMKAEAEDSRLPPEDFARYYLGSAVFMYANWQLCTLAGALFGHLMPGVASWGLEFAMPVAFIGMLSPYLRSLPTATAALTAGAVSILAYAFPNKLGLLTAALAGIVAGTLAELPTLRRKAP